MHPQIEKLEQLLAEAKNNKSAALDEFFGRLWMSGVFASASEIRAVVDKLYAWLKPLELHQPKNFALATLALGFAEFHEGKYESSLNDCIAAQKMFAELKDEDSVQVCAVMFASNYRSLGELELSLKYLLEAHRHLSKTDGYNVFKIFAVYTLAEIYNETKQLEEALHFYQLAVPLAESVGNPFMVARGYLGIGVVYQRQKKYALALEYFNKALQLCDQPDGLPVKARILTDMGVYYSDMGDYEAAVGYQQQALEIRERLHIVNAPITNIIHIGEIYQKQGKLDDAVTILNKGLLIAEELKVKAKIFQIHSLLSDVFQAKGETGKCLFHNKAFHQIRDEVMHEDNEKKIKNLHLVFEAEQTQKENAIIKEQKKEIERKNIQLQRTVDELTRTRVSRKAKAITLVVAVFLFLLEEVVLHITEGIYNRDNFILSLSIKGVILISLKPIENFIESFMLKKIMREKL